MVDKRKYLLAILLGGILLAACGSSENEPPPPATIGSDEQVAASVQQTVAAIAVAQTVEVLTQTQPTTIPGDATTTPMPTTQALPSSTVDSTLPPQATVPPSTQPPATGCTVVSDVFLRPGPGTAYNPPIVALRAGTPLLPLAYSPIGFPQGVWLNVQLPDTGQVGWVSAAPQFVQCDVDLSNLPLAMNLPPTPIPPATAAPTPTATNPALQPPNVDNDAPGGSFPEDGTVSFNIIVDPTFLFRMDVRDLTVGNFEGAGIESVEFSISGDGVNYFRREGTAGFCVFGGGEPTCRPWPTNELGQYTWGEGGPVVQTGDYFVNMAVTAEREDDEFNGNWNWNFDFRVTLP